MVPSVSRQSHAKYINILLKALIMIFGWLTILITENVVKLLKWIECKMSMNLHSHLQKHNIVNFFGPHGQVQVTHGPCQICTWVLKQFHLTNTDPILALIRPRKEMLRFFSCWVDTICYHASSRVVPQGSRAIYVVLPEKKRSDDFITRHAFLWLLNKKILI